MKNRLKLMFAKLNIFRSLKLRIFLLLVIVGVIPSMFVRYAVLQSYEEHAERYVRQMCRRSIRFWLTI